MNLNMSEMWSFKFSILHLLISHFKHGVHTSTANTQLKEHNVINLLKHIIINSEKGQLYVTYAAHYL